MLLAGQRHFGTLRDLQRARLAEHVRDTATDRSLEFRLVSLNIKVIHHRDWGIYNNATRNPNAAAAAGAPGLLPPLSMTSAA